MKRTVQAACCSHLVVAALLGMGFTACPAKKSKVYTVGVVSAVPALDQILTGFKEGMAGLGYVEGGSIRYLYDGPTTDLGQLPEAARRLAKAKVDLVLSITTPATIPDEILRQADVIIR